MTIKFLTMGEIKCVEEVTSQFEEFTEEDHAKVLHLVDAYKNEREPAYFRAYNAACRIAGLISIQKHPKEK